MAKARTERKMPRIATRGLLVQDKGRVYFIGSSALKNYALSVTPAQSALIAQFFKDVDKKFLVDAANVPGFHIFEGAG
jgi:hypothetical protein